MQAALQTTQRAEPPGLWVEVDAQRLSGTALTKVRAAAGLRSLHELQPRCLQRKPQLPLFFFDGFAPVATNRMNSLACCVFAAPAERAVLHRLWLARNSAASRWGGGLLLLLLLLLPLRGSDHDSSNPSFCRLIAVNVAHPHPAQVDAEHIAFVTQLCAFVRRTGLGKLLPALVEQARVSRSKAPPLLGRRVVPAPISCSGCRLVNLPYPAAHRRGRRFIGTQIDLDSRIRHFLELASSSSI